MICKQIMGVSLENNAGKPEEEDEEEEADEEEEEEEEDCKGRIDEGIK